MRHLNKAGLVLLISTAMLCLPSCRTTTVIGYENQSSSVVHRETGFTYELMFSIADNSPSMQTVVLSLRADPENPIELKDLSASLIWHDKSGSDTQVPFSHLWIFYDEGDSTQSAQFKPAPTYEDTDSLYLDSLYPSVPSELRSLKPGEERSFHIYFTGMDPDSPCIPASTEKISVEIDLVVSADNETTKVSKQIPLTPKEESFTEPYNLKSEAWNNHQCR